jgi:hypothetical protein
LNTEKSRVFATIHMIMRVNVVGGRPWRPKAIYERRVSPLNLHGGLYFNPSHCWDLAIERIPQVFSWYSVRYVCTPPTFILMTSSFPCRNTPSPCNRQSVLVSVWYISWVGQPAGLIVQKGLGLLFLWTRPLPGRFGVWNIELYLKIFIFSLWLFWHGYFHNSVTAIFCHAVGQSNISISCEQLSLSWKVFGLHATGLKRIWGHFSHARAGSILASDGGKFF